MTNSEIDELVDYWHDRYTGPLTLQQFLGMSEEEYARWINYGLVEDKEES